MSESNIKMYGAPWCPDCRRAKQFFGEHRVDFQWINVDNNPDALKYIEGVNNGKQIIPTIIFEDGSILAEPTNAELAMKLGIRPRATRQFFDVIIVGAGPAGLTAGIYCAREGLDPLVIERSGVCGQTSVTERIDNYPGFPEGIGGGPSLPNSYVPMPSASEWKAPPPRRYPASWPVGTTGWSPLKQVTSTAPAPSSWPAAVATAG